MADHHRHEIVPVGELRPETPKPAHGDPNMHAQSSREAIEQRESGKPGGGAGRRDDVGRTGVYPVSGDERPAGGAELRPLGDWAGGDRGIAGYEDSGGSELVMRDGQLLGGLTSDGAGRPTIDIHGAPPDSGQREPHGEPQGEPGEHGTRETTPRGNPGNPRDRGDESR